MKCIHISLIPQKIYHAPQTSKVLIYTQCRELWLVLISHQSSLFRALNQAKAAFLSSSLCSFCWWNSLLQFGRRR